MNPFNSKTIVFADPKSRRVNGNMKHPCGVYSEKHQAFQDNLMASIVRWYPYSKNRIISIHRSINTAIKKILSPSGFVL